MGPGSIFMVLLLGVGPLYLTLKRMFWVAGTLSRKVPATLLEMGLHHSWLTLTGALRRICLNHRYYITY